MSSFDPHTNYTSKEGQSLQDTVSEVQKILQEISFLLQDNEQPQDDHIIPELTADMLEKEPSVYDEIFM
jgi:hypothetical protein